MNRSQSLKQLADYVDYMHISDNNGLKVEHLQPGNGKINWDRFFETLDEINFKGYIGLDIGGEETKLNNVDGVYISSAKWVENKWSLIKKDKQ